MTTQLQFDDERPINWKLSRTTREIGRRGVAEARAALARTQRPVVEEVPTLLTAPGSAGPAGVSRPGPLPHSTHDHGPHHHRAA